MRQFFNAAGYPEHWAEGIDAIAAGNRFFGVFEPELVGCFWLQFWTDIPEIHVAFMPEHRGRKAVRYGVEFIRWFFQNTEHDGFFADIEDQHVAVYARLCGMKRVGNRFEVRRWERQ